MLLSFGQHSEDSLGVKTDIDCYLKVQEQLNILSVKDSIIGVQNTQINLDSIVISKVQHDVAKCTAIGQKLIKEREEQVKRESMKNMLLSALVPICFFETLFIFFVH